MKRKVIALLMAMMMMVSLCACGESKQAAVSDELAEEKRPSSSIIAGDIVKFGHYEQDNDLTNGAEEIEWQVLAKKDNRILIVSKYALDCQPYNTLKTNVTWENCSLRKWMNDTFFKNAFSKDEQVLIPTTNVFASENPEYKSNPGNAAADKVFLLSVDDVTNNSIIEKECAPTAYAQAQGARVDTYNSKCWWLLRSPGDNLDSAAFVNSCGLVGYYGYYVPSDNVCIRPALWVFEKAPVSKDVLHNADGSVKAQNEYAYDTYGDLAKEISYNVNGEVIDGAKYSHTYNKDGKPAEDCIYEANDKLRTRCVYTYDENGNCSKKSTYDAAEKLTGWIEYACNENGNITKESFYDASKKLTGWIEYTYNENGKIKKESSYNADEELTGWIEYAYNDSGKCTKESSYNADEELTGWIEYAYNNNGNLTKESSYDANKKLTGWTEYAYNDNGDLAKESSYGANKKITGWTECTYDENRNLTKSCSYDADGNLSNYTDGYTYLSQAVPQKVK